jgi:type IV pilus assembly protein PilN
MIRINLLPKKGSRKKMGLVQHLVLTGMVFLVTIAALGYFTVSLNGKITDLKGQVADARAEREELKDVNKEKNKYEQNIASLKNQLDIITKIKARRFLPVRLFDELTKVLNKDLPVWLTKFSIADEKIQVEGFSLSNRDLANFVTRLEKTPFFRSVDLLYSEKVNKDDREIYQFSLNALTETEDPAPPVEKAE